MQARQPAHKSGRTGRSDGAPYKLSVLFIEGRHGWTAQCLEHDIAAQASSLNALFEELERVLVAQVALDESQGKKPFEGIGPAPEKYWEAFRNARTKMQRPAAGLRASGAAGPRVQPTIRIAERAA